MTMRTLILSLVLSINAHVSFAQTPVTPVDRPRSVTLPLSEYNRLIDLAGRATATPATAAIAAVVSAADLRVTVDRDTARGVFNLAGQVLQPGVTRVPLVNGATLSDATSGGGPVPLLADGQTVNALIAGPGAFAIAVQWGGAVAFRPGRGSFILPVPQAGAARATIDLPGDQADVHLSSGLVTRRSAANGRTIIDATLDPGTATEVWWSMRDSAPVAAAKDVRALADIMTLITLDDSDVRMAGLVDITVTQGELRTLAVQLPAGYDLQSITGSTLEDFTQAGNEATLAIGNPAARSHQFLITLERAHQGGSFTLASGVITLEGIQRERGEIAIEGVGTMDLTAEERPGLHRIDVRELDSSLHSLARLPVLSAFRYQRASGSPSPELSIAIKPFADAGVLAAAADRATATTLITSEGRALTEVRLQMRNRSQPFLKVELPQGATIVSVDLAGESAKPATGADGTRIPLMRAGLRSSEPYLVSFVYVHSGTPFQKRGDIAMSLPKMDVPIGVVNWEVFVPEQYKARVVDGNVVEAIKYRMVDDRGGYKPDYRSPEPLLVPAQLVTPTGVMREQIRGRTQDGSGALLPGVTVRIVVGNYQATTLSDAQGGFVFSGVPHGEVTITADLSGFRQTTTMFPFDGSPRRLELQMEIGALMETITVTGEAPLADVRRELQPAAAPPSRNVVNLQARASGVLPIRIDVPRAGVSHEFIRPLVVGDEATVTLRYKRN
jgi:hypothetical protein